MKKLIPLVFALCFSVQLIGQKDTVRGLRFAFLPIATYDSDLGLKYGLLSIAYQFGDGSYYPDYVYNVSYEINHTTKGSGISQLFFDSGRLLKEGKHRVVADFSYIHEQATDFYGFNGSASHYAPEFENRDSSQYVSRMFYNFDRKILRLTADWHEQVSEKLTLMAGIHHYSFRQENVNISKLNEGRDADDLLPDTVSLLDLYVSSGVILLNDANGGNVTMLRTGVVYDTRDKEFNATKGAWHEAVLSLSPELPWIEKPFFRASVILRQYVPLVKNRLSLALRAGWQDQLGKQAPFYFMPYLSQSYCNNSLVEGLGGGKTLRGVLRNRIWGDGFLYGNIELRLRLCSFSALKQRIEIKMKPFYDFGIITDPVQFSVNMTHAANEPPLLLSGINDSWHQSAGAGLHFIMNDNFILTFDYGKTFNKNDGNSGLYIGTGFLF